MHLVVLCDDSPLDETTMWFNYSFFFCLVYVERVKGAALEIQLVKEKCFESWLVAVTAFVGGILTCFFFFLPLLLTASCFGKFD